MIDKLFCNLCRGGGKMVTILAFYSDYLSSNPAGYLFSVLHFKNTLLSEKETRVGPFKKCNDIIKLSIMKYNLGQDLG